MFYAIVAVICLILDQVAKYWTTANIPLIDGRVEVIPGLLHLTHIQNTGAAFSFLQGARWFFVVLCAVFVVAVIYLLVKQVIRHPVARWSAVVVMAGAVGNCLDRIICGYVVDMIELELFKFPVFNVADIFITVGVIVFVIVTLLEKPEGESGKQKAPVRQKVVVLSPEGEAVPAPAPAAGKRKRTKTEIPVFPKREQTPEPEMDPEHPFAEWEQEGEIPATPEAPAPQPPQPKEKPVVTVLPEPEAEPPKPKQDEFDLDSILAEFKDL